MLYYYNQVGSTDQGPLLNESLSILNFTSLSISPKVLFYDQNFKNGLVETNTYVAML